MRRTGDILNELLIESAGISSILQAPVLAHRITNRLPEDCREGLPSKKSWVGRIPLVSALPRARGMLTRSPRWRQHDQNVDKLQASLFYTRYLSLSLKPKLIKLQSPASGPSFLLALVMNRGRRFGPDD